MKATILIIEDNARNRTLLRDVLAYHGYRVIEADNGRDGLAAAREHLPEIVLLDILMPVMDGFGVLRGLKDMDATRHIKVLALTSCAMCGDREKILAAGFDDYIAKPIDTRQLPIIVARHLAETMGREDERHD